MNAPSPAAEGRRKPKPEFRPRLAYSVPQAAEALSVSRSTINRWIELGTIRSVKIGGRRVIPHVELERILAPVSAAA